MKTESQCKRIYELLQKGVALTPLDALKLVGTMKLATRISELRASGIDNIEQTMVEVGDGKCVMKYWINPNNRRDD